MATQRSASGASNQPPLMPAVPPTAYAAANPQQQYIVDETGAAYAYDPQAGGMDVAESYYKEDGTFVQVMADGTEYHYPPETAAMDDGGMEAPPPAAAAPPPQHQRENPLEEHKFYPIRGAQSVADGAAVHSAGAAHQNGGGSATNNATAATSRSVGGAAPGTTSAAAAVEIPPEQQAARANGEVTEREAMNPKGGAAGAASSLHEEDDGSMWIARLATEIFLSLAFKCYLTGLLYSCFAIEFFIGFDYMWACLFRVFAPPDSTRDPFWQSFCFMAIFLVLSFVIVAMLVCVIDITREFWMATRKDHMLWGLNTQNTPPWLIHGLTVIATTLVPLLWSFIVTLSQSHTAIFFVQHLCYSTIIVPLCLTIGMYIWYFCLSLWQKSRAHQLTRIKEDDGDDGGPDDTTVVTASGRPVTVKSWYHHDSILREYGLDARTLLWMIPVFIVGLAPLFVLSILIATTGTTVTWNISWTIVAVAFLVLLAVMRELTNSKHKSNAAIGCIVLILLFIVLALIGAGSSGNPNLFGVFLITGMLCQFFMLRKRPYRYGKIEITETFGPAADEVPDAYDSYLCCCKNTLFTCLGACFDMRGVFGVTLPEVRRIEKERRARRTSLWSDQKFVMYYWILFWVTLIFVLSYDKSTAQIISVNVGQRTNVPVFPNTNGLLSTNMGSYDGNVSLHACTLRYNSGSTGKSSLGLVDLAFLSALGYSYGNQWFTDFSTWFSHTNLVVVGNPAKTAGEAVGLTGWATWVDFYDATSGFHYVGVQGINMGVAWMRNVDIWGDSLTLEAAQVAAPGVWFWPIGAKRDFVNGISFWKRIMGGMNATQGLENYVRNLTMSGQKVLVFGHGPNGGLARLVGAKLNVQSLSFGGPGIAYMTSKYGLNPDSILTSLNIKNTNDVVSLVDDNSRDGAQIMIPCPASTTLEDQCDQIVSMARVLVGLCGDQYGRGIANFPGTVN